VNIDAVGSQQNTYAVVQINNFELGINEIAKAIPEEFIGAGGTLAAVLTTAERVLTELLKTGRLKAPSNFLHLRTHGFQSQRCRGRRCHRRYLCSGGQAGWNAYPPQIHARREENLCEASSMRIRRDGVGSSRLCDECFRDRVGAYGPTGLARIDRGESATDRPLKRGSDSPRRTVHSGRGSPGQTRWPRQQFSPAGLLPAHMPVKPADQALPMLPLRREYEYGIGTISGVAQKYKVHRRTVLAPRPWVPRPHQQEIRRNADRTAGSLCGSARRRTGSTVDPFAN